MDCSMPGFPVFHYLLEFSQIHIHWIGDAILPSYPLSSPSPPALNFSQHQGLFQWVGSLQSIGASASVSVLPMSIQDWFPLGLTLGRLSRVFSSTTIQKHQFFSAQPSYSPTLPSVHDYWKSRSWLYGPLSATWCLCFLICCLGLSQLFFQGATIF